MYIELGTRRHSDIFEMENASASASYDGFCIEEKITDAGSICDFDART